MLSDRSVTVQRESSHALGQGLRLGFLGSASNRRCPPHRGVPLLTVNHRPSALHMDVFRQRLEDEYNSDVIITAPSVPYKRASSLPPRPSLARASRPPDLTPSSSRRAQ